MGTALRSQHLLGSRIEKSWAPCSGNRDLSWSQEELWKWKENLLVALTGEKGARIYNPTSIPHWMWTALNKETWPWHTFPTTSIATLTSCSALSCTERLPLSAASTRCFLSFRLLPWRPFSLALFLYLTNSYTHSSGACQDFFQEAFLDLLWLG